MGRYDWAILLVTLWREGGREGGNTSHRLFSFLDKCGFVKDIVVGAASTKLYFQEN